MPRLTAIARAAFLALIAAGCTGGTFLGDGSSKKKDDDGRRPSEQGEGLVGYLRDPNELRIQREGSQLHVDAPEGALIVSGGSPASIIVCLQQVGREDLYGILSSGAGFGGAAVATLARAQALASGAFRLSVDAAAVDTAKLLTVNVTGQCATDAMLSSLRASGTSIVFKDQQTDAPFGGAAVFYPEFGEPETNGGDDPAMPLFCGFTEPGAEVKPPEPLDCDVDVVLEVSDGQTSQPLKEGTKVEVYLADDCTPKEPCKTDPLGVSVLSSGSSVRLRGGVDYLLRFTRPDYQTYEEAITAGKTSGVVGIVLEPI